MFAVNLKSYAMSHTHTTPHPPRVRSPVPEYTRSFTFMRSKFQGLLLY